MATELLFEIFGEEIPALFQEKAAAQWKDLAHRLLLERGLSPQELETWITPRRLGLWVSGLPETLPIVTQTRKGPREGCSAKAIDGFLKSCGVETAQLHKTPQGIFWIASIPYGGNPTVDLIPNFCNQMIDNFRWPKSMKWGKSQVSWVRPIRRLLCLWNQTPLIFIFDPDGEPIQTGHITEGHRFLKRKTLAITSFQDYKRQLKASYVLYNTSERRNCIQEQILSLAHQHNLEPFPEDLEPGSLIDEVTGLVEWPNAHLGSFSPQFLDLPPEIVTTPMRKYQRYFPLRDPQTKILAPTFAIISNTITPDGGQTLVKGHERVLKARLTDALFFWQQDCQTPLKTLVQRLTQRGLFENLGSLYEKTQRLEHLALAFFPDNQSLIQSCHLCKGDLMSHMVREFPELQGLMGGYYAHYQGYNQDIAQAIATQYWPCTPKEPNSTGIILGILDRIDTLVGFFALGLTPTGSKDPFALRRAGSTLVHLLLKQQVPLTSLINKVFDLYKQQGLLEDASAPDLMPFLQERLKVILQEEQISASHIEAAFNLSGEFREKAEKVRQLHCLLQTSQGQNLLTLYRRISPFEQILQPVQPDLFSDPAEQDLWSAVEKAPVTPAALAALYPLVETFFQNVLINAKEENIRMNRLALLTHIMKLMEPLGDFSKIEG